MISLDDMVKAQQKDTNPYKVSVVITCYNQELYIAKALDSVLAQKTSFPYRIIVSDDASKDRSQEILKQYEENYPEKMKVLYHHENHGMTGNRNSILRICDTPYVAFLDGDDYWCDDEQLERKYDFLEKHPEYMGYFTAGGSENDLDQNDYVVKGINSDFTNMQALRNDYPGMYGGFFIRNMYKYMAKADFDAYVGFALDETSKMPIFAAMIGDIYRGDKNTTWVYREVEGSLSKQESQTRGCDGYFYSRMSMMKMVKTFFGKDMQIEDQLEELVYNAFVSCVKHCNKRNRKQFSGIYQYGYYTRIQIIKIVVHRLLAKIRK